MIVVKQNGDLRTIAVHARNLSETDLPEASMHFSLSSGISIVQFTPEKGTWNASQKVWDLGLFLKKSTALYADITFKVTDITKAPFYIERWLKIKGIDNPAGTSNFTEIIFREQVSVIVPKDKVCSALCGNLNDECEGHCATGKSKIYQLIAGSQVNCEVTIDKAGSYSVLPTYPTSGGSFKYYMFCEGLDGTEGPYGPITRSFPASYKGLPCEGILACVMNTDKCSPAPNQCQICISGVLIDKAFGTPCSSGTCKHGICST